MVEKLLRLPAVMDMTGLSRSAVFAYMSEGKFPKSFSIGARAKAWRLSEIQQWIEEQCQKGVA